MNIRIKPILAVTAALILLPIFHIHLHAHHQLGLPHYMYTKEYPQIPSMVIDADAEGYTVSFSTYPGNPRPGDTVRIKIYIVDNKTGAVYNRQITVSISTLFFFFIEDEKVKTRTVDPEFNKYSLSYQFPEAEKYLVNVTFEPRPGFFEKIPFPIVIGQTNFSLVPFAAGFVFLVIFVLVGIKKKKRG